MFERFLGAAALAIALNWVTAAPGVCAEALNVPSATGAPSADDFGRLPAISSLTLSPDGKRIAALTSPDGQNNYITIWSTDAMSQKPQVIAPLKTDGFHFVGVRFLKNDEMGVTYQQFVVGDNPAGGQRHFQVARMMRMSASKLGGDPQAMISVSGGDSVQILNLLPTDPRNILVEVDPSTIYTLDVYTGAVRLVHEGTNRWTYDTDAKGDIRVRCGQFGDGAASVQSCDVRNTKTSAWEPLFSWRAQDREPTSYAAMSDDPNIVLLLTTKGRDKAAVVDFDITQHKVVEPAFEHKLFDAEGVLTSDRTTDLGRTLGFVYDADTRRVYWTDPRFAGLESALRTALRIKVAKIDWIDPSTGAKARIDEVDDADIAIIAYSDDLSRVVVEKSGPSQPPEYYLLVDSQKLYILGKAFPTIAPAALGHTRLVEYTARDGLIVPAFVTTPPASFGAGPFPAIVTPHGGPWERDYLDWDPTGWTQYFAARGYVVIQPQFRGSQGWGQKLWRAGDREWGQKIQDDIDDSARWLIDQGLARKGEIAIHGYSFGGYSAFAAAVRPKGLYRCAIAGAGVAEMARIKTDANTEGFESNFQGVTIDGLSPLDHTSDVTIPVMAYHGAADQTVPVEESERFTNKLKAKGKPYRYVEIPDMGHQINLWSPQNKRDILLAVDDFLKTDCGMGR